MILECGGGARGHSSSVRRVAKIKFCTGQEVRFGQFINRRISPEGEVAYQDVEYAKG